MLNEIIAGTNYFEHSLLTSMASISLLDDFGEFFFEWFLLRALSLPYLVV